MNLHHIPKHVNITGIESESEKIHKQLDQLVLAPVNQVDFSLKKEFAETFEKLCIQCVTDKYYWQYCPSLVYRATFNDRLNDWLTTYTEAKKSEFIQVEIDDLDSDYAGFTYKVDGRDHSPLVYLCLGEDENIYCQILDLYLTDETLNKLCFSTLRKLEYLENLYEQSGKKEEQSESPIDNSDISSAEKIAFLYELGILDGIRKRQPEGMSINKLAQVVSNITGINQTTVQSYLNPIYSKKVDQKNSPLKEKILSSVHEKISKIGVSKI
jgi:hypothetical protein